MAVQVLFPWFGGKTLMLPKLLRMIPPHHLYVEVFGGSGALLLAKEPAPIEVYNDIDSRLVNFFRVVRDRDKMKQLQWLMDLTPYSREEFEAGVHVPDGVPEDVAEAYRFFYKMRCAFSGMEHGVFAYSLGHARRGMSSRVSSYLSAIDGLDAVYERLRTVQIEHLDWRECLDRYERVEGFYYLDPPYHPDCRVAGKYAHDFSAREHEELVQRLLYFEGKVLLSGYDHPVYRPLEEAGWHKAQYDALTRCKVTHGDGAVYANPLRKRKEVLWWNYDLDTMGWFGED